jgi:thioesterase domain-containing protein
LPFVLSTEPERKPTGYPAPKAPGRRPGVASVKLSPATADSGKPPLFLLYGLFLYRELARCLGPDQPTYGIYVEEELGTQHEHAEFPFSSVEEVAGRYIEEIRAIQPDGPYQLGGESFGGLVAFEVAQRLVRQGEEVALLTLFDTGVPGHYTRSNAERLRNHLGAIRTIGPVHLSYMGKRLASRVLGAWRNLGSGGRDFAESRSRIARRYQVGPFPGKIVVFKAFEDYRGARADDLGWTDYAEELVVYEVPGDHVGILKQPNVSILADKLTRHLYAQG